MVLLVRHEIFEEHDTGAHPESLHRAHSLRTSLPKSLIDRCTTLQPCDASSGDIQLVHSAGQIAAIQALSEAGGGYLDADTILSPRSFEVARKAVGSCLKAAKSTIEQDEPSLCLVRPPGHHATPKESMGFCLFNNVAVVARHVTETMKIGKVLIVDWDVHHGNGTQDAFFDSDRIYFLSMHRFPFYPGTGDADEVGTGRGRGFNRNLPIAFGTDRQTIIQRFADAVDEAIAKIKPEMLIISAGFDAHRADPIGSLGLESVDYRTLTNIVTEGVKPYASRRVISCLEGGYNLAALVESVGEHLTGLLENEGPALQQD